MKKSLAAPALILLAFLCGCAPEPFTRAPLPPLINPDPVAMRDGFLLTLPRHRFTLDETVIIQAPFHDDLAVLGELMIDRSADRFELVGLNQLAVTLFKLRGDSDRTTIEFAVPELTKNPDLLLSIGHDIRRIYFDLLPAKAAALDIGQTTVRFTQNTTDGKLVYEFGGQPPVLLEKRLDGFFGPIWRVRYYQYASTPDGLYPYGIVMDNNQFHYRIIIKNRAMHLASQ